MGISSLSRQISVARGGFDRTLQLKQRSLARLQEQMASGLRVNRPSDDATSFNRARRMEGLSSRYEQYQRSISTSQTWVDYTQDNLNELADIVTQIYEEGVQGGNDTLDQEGLDALADTIDSLVEEAVDILNIKVGDEYLFAGTATTDLPFDATPNPTTGVLEVTYLGNTGDRTRPIGPEQYLDINTTGDQLLNTGSSFTIIEAMTNMSEALRNGASTDIDTALAEVQTSQTHVLNLAAASGTKANRLNDAFDYLEGATILVEGERSRAEDADLAETILNLQQEQLGLQTALQALATVQQTSLLDYLR